ncbi:MAG: hypothetical protein ACI849_001290, partial [Patiriisocius sp.]
NLFYVDKLIIVYSKETPIFNRIKTPFLYAKRLAF